MGSILVIEKGEENIGGVEVENSKKEYDRECEGKGERECGAGREGG
jgi:hypothetical protein